MKIFVLVAIVFIYVIWQKQELKKFKVTNYEFLSAKIEHAVRIVMIADLHSHVYGIENDELIDSIKEQKPDIIVIPGDMIVSAKIEKYQIALDFLWKVKDIAPIYYSNGNHESCVSAIGSNYRDFYEKYELELEKMGIHVLNNREKKIEVNGSSIHIYGVEIPLRSYKKWRKIALPPDYLNSKLGGSDTSLFCMLLAHNPAYAKDYVAWGADLTLSGHMHGGLIRIPRIGSLISPQLQLFPKYDAGEWRIGNNRIIVSKGLGTHTFNIRIFNRAELVTIDIKPQHIGKCSGRINEKH